jgi:hypothetical protein
MTSVLQDWVTKLQLREQGVLLTAVRGCDLAPKTPETLASTERELVAWIRWCFMRPADIREVDHGPGCFFRSSPPQPFKPGTLGHYPLHWYSHAMHALEIIGYRHPNKETAQQAFDLYCVMVYNLHLNPETKAQMECRLGEDRIANRSVVQM